uniref:Uncharacterized protein n=1 Tax=Ananas comosus var. bracteatus TaxID=296719 RepID=A0A6V7NYD0_ANACO|nr:unnamed protein product [Ananas comosus var. bracteatus]
MHETLTLADQLSGSPQRAVYRYKLDGCTGTGLMVVPVQPLACTGTGPVTLRPEPRVVNFAGLVPVQGPVYRYKAADFVQFELQGAFRDCGPFITAPTPLRAFFVLEPEEEKGTRRLEDTFVGANEGFRLPLVSLTS